MGLIFRNEVDPPMRQVRINNSAMAWTGLDWYCMSHTGGASGVDEIEYNLSVIKWVLRPVEDQHARGRGLEIPGRAGQGRLCWCWE